MEGASAALPIGLWDVKGVCAAYCNERIKGGKPEPGELSCQRLAISHGVKPQRWYRIQANGSSNGVHQSEQLSKLGTMVPGKKNNHIIFTLSCVSRQNDIYMFKIDYI